MCWKPKYEYELKQRIEMTIREKANNYAKSKNSDCPKSIIECYAIVTGKHITLATTH